MARKNRQIQPGDTITYETTNRLRTDTILNTGKVKDVVTNAHGHQVAKIETADGGTTSRYTVTVTRK